MIEPAATTIVKRTTKESAIKVAVLGPGDHTAWLAYMRDNLPAWSQFHSQWQWRQQGLPHSGGESAAVATVAGSVTGCVGIVPVAVTYQGRYIQAAWQQDSLVSAAMRGKGLGKKLVCAAAQSYELVLAKGTSHAMYGLRKALGYNDVPLSDYLVTVLRPTLDPKTPAKAALELALCLWQKMLPPPRRPGGLSIDAISAFDAAYDDLAVSLAQEARISPFKSAAYLNWRYFKCPVKAYTVLQAADKQLRGAIVLGTSNAAPANGWVVDLLCASADKSCAYSLLAEALHFFSKRGVKRIWTFATLPAARRRLMRFGFVPTWRSPRFTFLHRGSMVAPDLLRSPCWNVWHGDGDLDLYL